MSKLKIFSDMSSNEINDFEKYENALIILQSNKAIGFSKTVDQHGNPVLIIMPEKDSHKTNITLVKSELDNLKKLIN